MTGRQFGAGPIGDRDLGLVLDLADVGRQRRQEVAHARGEAAERGPLPCPEQHAGQLAALIEDRPARIALPGFDVELDHLLRKIRAAARSSRCSGRSRCGIGPGRSRES